MSRSSIVFRVHDYGPGSCHRTLIVEEEGGVFLFTTSDEDDAQIPCKMTTEQAEELRVFIALMIERRSATAPESEQGLTT